MFNVTNVLSVAATEDGNTLFMLVEGGVIYSWDAVNNYRVIYEEASLIAPLVVDSFNNLYVVNLTQHPFISNRIFTLYYFNAMESYQSNIQSSLFLKASSSHEMEFNLYLL